MKMLLKSKNVFMTRVEDRDCILKSGMEEEVVETYDRLAELLEKMQKSNLD